jgi:hypothetical protein
MQNEKRMQIELQKTQINVTSLLRIDGLPKLQNVMECYNFVFLHLHGMVFRLKFVCVCRLPKY